MEIWIDDQERVFVRYSYSGSYTVLHPDGTTKESYANNGGQLVYDSAGPQPDCSSDDYNAGWDDGFSTAEQKSNGRPGPSREPAVVTQATGGRP